MKKVLLAMAVSFISIAGFSQERQAGSELSIGLEGGLPLNGWKVNDEIGKFSNFGVGATAKYAYNFDESIAATLQSGYIYFFGKNLQGTGVKVKTSQIPVKAGIRFSMGKFYAEPQLGVSFLHQSLSAPVTEFDGISGSTSAFTYAGNIGVMASQNFDISLRYEGFSKDGNAGFLGLRLAYTFPLGK
ncbi:MAG: hypothetical protein DI598_08025 [Pseudopedobacter saltans]|uniref:Outer membrane protein beta-barrel domain-containing protein n=1 Tax=Pseudopedobacter saltans TaxID=151895 RepID=A0A2W5F3J4_9SPHI|nr:MAG: hypothetical protein DI598_08025 [Pseudopedobacter saltans]